MMEFHLIGDRQLVARLQAMPAKVKASLTVAVFRLALDLQLYVQRDKLSGQVLNRRTGLLRSSINVKGPTTTDDRIEASVGTNVVYGRFHEFGVAHSWLVQAKRAKALRFKVGDRWIFRKRVMIRGLPERSFLRSALKENQDRIRVGLEEAIAEGLRE